MNSKQIKKLDAEIESANRKEAAQLIEDLADAIMKNRRLAAEVASRWAKKHGYMFANIEAADAMLGELRHLNNMRAGRKVQA